MKLTANSAIYKRKDEGNPHVASLEYFHRAGFDGMDINLGGAMIPGHYLNGKDWKKGIQDVAETAERLQMEISQSHLPFYNFADPQCQDLEEKNRMFARMVEASGMLGIKWAVFHPGNAVDSVLGVKESKRRTIEFLKPYMELAETYQVDCLRMVGDRLKAVHVHDNNGIHDDHQIPFTHCCSVEWEKVLPVLKEIGYQGNFNFEVMNSRMPQGVEEGFGIYLEQLGRVMIGMTG